MRLIIALLVLLTINFATAQDYFKVQIGYALPLNGDYLTSDRNVIEQFASESSSQIVSAKGIYGSYATGIQAEAGVLIAVSKQFDFGADLTYIFSKKIEGKTVSSSTFNPSAGVKTTIDSRYNSSLQVSPIIRFKLPAKKFTPYIGFGPVFSFFGTFTNKQGDKETIDSYSVKVGFKNVLGVIYKYNKLTTFIEVGMLNLSIDPEDLTNNTYNLTPATRRNNPMSNLNVNAGLLFPLSIKKTTLE